MKTKRMNSRTEERKLVLAILQLVAPNIKPIAQLRDSPDNDDAWIAVAKAKRNRDA